MIGLLQRVLRAEIRVAGECVGRIGSGLAVLVAVERTDEEAQADRLLERLLNYRVFPDADGRMNRNVAETRGGLLLVPQFTLAADTRKGNRPGFSRAASPEKGVRLFEYLLARAESLHTPVAGGRFGAHMEFELVNDGPVTFWLQTATNR